MLDDALKIGTVNFKLNQTIRDYFKDDFDQNRRIKTPYGELGEIIYHIFDTTSYWISVMKNEDFKPLTYEDLKTSKEFFDEWERIDNMLIEFIKENNSKNKLNRIVHVQFRPDVVFNSKVEDLIMHISHHSMYHRSSLAAMVRINNITPLPGSTWSFVIQNSS